MTTQPTPEDAALACLFYGVWVPGRAGHYLYDTHGQQVWDMGRRWMMDPDGRLAPPGKQTERRVAMHSLHGWTCLSMWDRTGDDRDHSSATFWVPGRWHFAEAESIARVAFPSIVERICAPLTLTDYIR
jgi:hypothetical protein